MPIFDTFGTAAAVDLPIFHRFSVYAAAAHILIFPPSGSSVKT